MQEHPESVPAVVGALLERYGVKVPAALRSGIALALKACCNELEPEHVQRCLEFMLSQGMADADGQIWEQMVSAGDQTLFLTLLPSHTLTHTCLHTHWGDNLLKKLGADGLHNLHICFQWWKDDLFSSCLFLATLSAGA